MRVLSASAVFQVRDLRKAIAFYTEKLGFVEEFIYGDPPYYAGVRHEEAIIHLSTSECNHSRVGTGLIYVICDEVDEYYRTLRQANVEVTSELETWPYGMRDFQIRDPDGNGLCFGASVETP